MKQYFETISPLTAKDVLDAAKAGDALAEQAAENMMQALGRAASLYRMCCQPGYICYRRRCVKSR